MGFEQDNLIAINQGEDRISVSESETKNKEILEIVEAMWDKNKMANLINVLHTVPDAYEMNGSFQFFENINKRIIFELRRKEVEKLLRRSFYLKPWEKIPKGIENKPQLIAFAKMLISKKDIEKDQEAAIIKKEKSRRVYSQFMEIIERDKCSDFSCTCEDRRKCFNTKPNGLCATYATIEALISALSDKIDAVPEVRAMHEIFLSQEVVDREEILQAIESIGSLVYERGFDMVLKLLQAGSEEYGVIIRGVLKAEEVPIKKISTMVGKRLCGFYDLLKRSRPFGKPFKAFLSPEHMGGSMIVCVKEKPKVFTERKIPTSYGTRMKFVPKTMKYKGRIYALQSFLSTVAMIDKSGEIDVKGTMPTDHVVFTQRIDENNREQWCTMSDKQLWFYENLDEHCVEVKALMYKPVTK